MLVCVCVCVCMFVLLSYLTNKDSYISSEETVQGEREDQVRVLLRSVKGCGSNVRKNYTYPKISLSRGVVLSQGTFHLVLL